MYRQGIGDCFLLTFVSGPQPQHILIDCGVLSGTADGKNKMQRVARNIKEVTNNRLSALVVTHEHWDHVSGFYDARDVFDNMEVGEIWVAWTEDPSHPVARELKAQNQARLKGIQLALAHLAETADPRYQAYGQGISQLLGFFGGPAAGASLAAFSEKTSQAMERVTKRSPSPTYWQPGNLIRPDWLPGVRIYVLGPPLGTKMLKKTEGRSGVETYGLIGADRAFVAALEQTLALDDAGDPEAARQINAALPFDQSLQWREGPQARIDREPFYQAYTAKDAAWRRIDNAWLLSMARLALQLDNGLNNTSLVLAFELTATGEVLLFPGDAQIGSWKSWLGLEWQLKDSGAEPKSFNTTELLQRTVFYKVGHHGSHNATLKDGGLEVMTAPDLVAAIPVDQVFANHSKRWEMPARALYERLQASTAGRILRADAAWPTAADQPPPNVSPQAWKKFTSAVSLDPNGLFIDYLL
jgi:beta-lactamase superfamily II metal-dependent hydrolase